MPGLGVGPGSAFRQDILAARPPAVPSLQGYFFFATDDNNGTLYQCTGSGWIKITNGLYNIVGGTDVSIMSAPGTVTVNSTYSLPIASGSQLGGFKVGSGLVINPSGVLSVVGLPDSITFVVSGAGLLIQSGVVGDLYVPYDCVINQVTMLSDRSTSTVMDIWRTPYAGFPPNVTNSITASNQPAISSGIKFQDSTLTGWNTTISSGDVLRFNVNSNDNAQLLSIILAVART